jgi:hypothetical protein
MVGETLGKLDPSLVEHPLPVPKVSNLHLQFVVGIDILERVELFSLKLEGINAFLNCADEFINFIDL